MSWSSTLQTIKSKVRTDTAGWSLRELATLADLVSLDERGTDQGLVGTAVESVYGERYRAHVAGWSCDRLTAAARETTDAGGIFHGRAARAESDAISSLTDARHPDVEPIDTFTDGDNYGEHARAVILAATPCANHGRVMGSMAAYAVGRFNPAGVEGYRAATAPGAPLRSTRAAAVNDERAHLGA